MRLRTSLTRAFAAAIALGGLWVASTQQPNQPLTVEKLADDLHIIVGSGGNVAVLTTDEGVILVDDKFDRNVPEIVEKVKSITSQPVRYVINTHHHGDHSGGNQTLIKSAEIVAHDNVYANMMNGRQPGPPRITFRDQLSVRLGGKEVRAYHFGRGHTNGDSVIHFPTHRIIHTGDLFVGGTPFIDYANGGSGIDWSNTLNQALQLDFERVIPGHGPVMARRDLAKWNEGFGVVRQRVSELKFQGRSKEEIAQMLKLDDVPGWRPSPLWARSLPGLYDELR
ncbi:MAG: MBL fold metallo-hydrolase [Bryobacterales bacterium]|nr:MBL fold metallo-hydrolase [Bryobacterales bacterium]